MKQLGIFEKCLKCLNLFLPMVEEDILNFDLDFYRKELNCGYGSIGRRWGWLYYP
jgi:hypothetical protein